MKRLLTVLLVIIMVIGLAGTASAVSGLTNWAYGFTTQCVNTSTLYNAARYIEKETTANFVEVRTNVIGNGSGAGYTNRIYAHKYGFGYCGAKWHVPDGIYHSCTSSNLAFVRIYVTPGGRGNTKYHDNLGLTTIRLEGQFRTH